MPTFKDYFQLHFIVLIWGFTAILGLYIHVSSLALVFYRTLIATVLLVGMLWLTGKSFQIKRNELLKILGTGVLIALHWIFFFGSAKISNASVCLAGMTTATLWTSLLEPMWMRRKMSRFEIALGLVIILGLYVIFQFEFNHVAGLAMAIISAFLGTLFSLANADLVKKHDHWVITFYEMLGAWITSSTFLFFYMWYSPDYAFPVVPTWQDWFCLFLLGGICTVYAYSIGVKLMKKFTPFAINLTVNLEPVYGIMLAFFLFGDSEKMHTGFYIGTAIILLAVFSYPILKNYFAQLRRKRLLKAIAERKAGKPKKTGKEKEIMMAAMFLFLLTFGQCSNSSEAYLKKGRELLKTQKFEEAKDFLNKAIAQDAKNADAFNARGVAFYNLNDTENAMLDYNQAIKLNDKLHNAYNNRAMLHTAKQKYNEALADYSQAIRLRPDTASFYSARGSLYFRLEVYDKALQDFQEAFKRNSKDHKSLFNIASINYRYGDLKQAILQYKQCVQLEANSAYTHYALGIAQLANNETQDACQSLKQAEKLGDKNATQTLKQYCK